MLFIQLVHDVLRVSLSAVAWESFDFAIEGVVLFAEILVPANILYFFVVFEAKERVMVFLPVDFEHAEVAEKHFLISFGVVDKKGVTAMLVALYFDDVGNAVRLLLILLSCKHHLFRICDGVGSVFLIIFIVLRLNLRMRRI